MKYIRHKGIVDESRNRINSRMIAAAPDMLAALRAILNCCAMPGSWGVNHVCEKCINQAFAAVEAATGKKL